MNRNPKSSHSRPDEIGDIGPEPVVDWPEVDVDWPEVDESLFEPIDDHSGLTGHSRQRRAVKRLSPRRRAFARAIAEGVPKRNAQIAAGYRPNRKNANLILRDERMRAEIERLKRRRQQRPNQTGVLFV